VFIGNLAESVDERTLREVFSQFGIVISTEVKRDAESGKSKHYGFVSFDNFESSDRARELMNG
jgi:RNA recognition motif-containing protein